MSLKKIINILIIISLLSGVFLIYNRINSERSNKNVEIILDYNEIDKMSLTSNETVVDLLAEFKKMGINTVALSEMTLSELMKKEKDLTTTLVSDLNKDSNWQNNYSQETIEYISSHTDKHDVIVKVHNLDLYKLLKTRLAEIYPEKFYKTFESNKHGIIILDGTYKDSYYAEENVYVDFEGENIKRPEKIISSKLLDIGFGFYPDQIEKVNKAGLEVILRPMNYSRFSSEKTDYFIKYTETNNIIPRYFVFMNQVLGYPDNLESIVSYIEKNDILPVVIETTTQRKNIEQDGLEEIMKSINYETTRAFSILDYIQERFQHYNYDGAQEIENSMYRAITERNIRLIYFKPFKYNEKEYVLEMKYYKHTFDNLEKRLAEHGLSYGPISGMKSNSPNYIASVLLTYGSLALGIFILFKLFTINTYYYKFMIFLSLIIIASMYYFAFNFSSIIFAFINAILFSTISSFYLLKGLRKRLFVQVNSKKDIVMSILKISALTISISLLGGLFIGALLSNSKYLLEFSIYRGVLLSEIIPLIIFSGLYLLILGYNKPISKVSSKEYHFSDLIDMLNGKVKIKYIIMTVLLALFGYIYIARAGHETNIQPSTIEMIFRNFLENNLLARPRTKEFLIAFPSLMITIYLANVGLKKYLYPFSLVSVIGFTSIINTFSHLRTPIYLSLIRTVYSAAFGMIIGSVLIFILDYSLKKLGWIKS